MFVVLATEISELNIVARSVPEQLHSLQDKERELSETLAAVGDEVRQRREVVERETRSELASLQTQILQLKRELEVSVITT